MKLGLPLIFMALVAAPSSGWAWTNIGPFGGVARSIAANANGTELYVMNPRSGLFRSSGGGPWMLVFDAVERGVTTTSVAADPQTSRVYAGTSNGVYRSDDAGVSWRPMNADSIIAVDAVSDRVIISALSGVARSSDAGETWTSIGSPPSDVLAPVSLVRIDPRDPSHIVALIAGHVFTSGDFGDSWQKLDATGVSATFGNVLYAGGSSGVFACSSTCARVISDPVVDVAYWRGTLYAATPTGVLSGGLPIVGMFSLLATPSALLAGTTAGVFSTDDGMRWTSRSEGLTNVRISALATAGGKLFAATRGQGLMRRDDVWIETDAGLPTLPPASPIAVALASDGATLYAGFSVDGLFRSLDLGTTWRDVSAGLPTRDISAVAATAALVIVTTAKGTFQSSDRGATWQRDTSFDVLGPIQNIAIAGPSIFATSERGIFLRSGGSWSGPGFAGARINALTAAGSRAFVAVTAAAGSDLTNGIYFTDDGMRWTFLGDSNSLPGDVTAIASDGSLMYAGTDGGSVFTRSLLRRRRVIRH